MEDLIAFFYKKIDGCKARSLDRIEYAFYLSIDSEELCKGFFQYFSNTNIRNKILRHIKKRFQTGAGDIPAWFLEKLLNDFSSSEGRCRISLGTAIKELSDYYISDDIRDFINWQIFSGNILDRKRAYVLSEKIYNHEIEALLFKAWKEFGDEGCISVLVKTGTIEMVAEIFNEIWKDEELKFYIKNLALKRVASFDFNKVKFIEHENPISFLSASIAAGRDVSDDFVLSTARSATSINELGYIFWCAGKLSKKEAIFSLIQEIKNIEEELPLEFWEPEFYDLS